MQDSCGFKKGLSYCTTVISKDPWCDDSVSTQLLSKQAAEHQGCSSGWIARAWIESRWICFLWSVRPSSRPDSGKGPNQITQVHWNSIKGYHTLPGRKISHEKLWDQLLERHGDVRVVRTRDVVQLNGSQNAILHVEVLHVLCPLATLALLWPGSCTDVAGHILLHQQGAITLHGCEGFKESKQTGNNIIHTSWEGTTAPSAFQCPQHDLDPLAGNGHAYTACCRVLTGIENSFAKYTGTLLGRQDCGYNPTLTLLWSQVMHRLVRQMYSGPAETRRMWIKHWMWIKLLLAGCLCIFPDCKLPGGLRWEWGWEKAGRHSILSSGSELTCSTQAGNTGPVGSLMGNVFSHSKGNTDSTRTKPLGGSYLSHNYRDFVVTGCVKCP